MGDCGPSDDRTHEVGTKAPNAFGLHDMHGNVDEWVEDLFNPGFYALPEAAGPDPVSTTGSGVRLGRGGSWGSDARGCRSTRRRTYDPDDRTGGLGFRAAFYPLPD